MTSLPPLVKDENASCSLLPPKKLVGCLLDFLMVGESNKGLCEFKSMFLRCLRGLPADEKLASPSPFCSNGLLGLFFDDLSRLFDLFSSFSLSRWLIARRALKWLSFFTKIGRVLSFIFPTVASKLSSSDLSSSSLKTSDILL